jgi:predicted peptidase
MAFAKAVSLLFRGILWVIVAASMIIGGSAKANSSVHYPKQEPIAHTLPAAVGTFRCQPLPPGSKDDFHTCRYTGPGNVVMTFYLFIPDHYDPTKSYPLTLILHGSGERSIASQTAAQNRAALLDNEYVAVWGPGSPAGGPSVQTTYPSFVLAPQIPLSDSWVATDVADGSYALPAQPTVDLATAMVILQLVRQQYVGINANRLYITGISMGAFGVWDAIERWPDYFAAAVPVAGAGSPALASELRTTAIWAFHGAADISVPPTGSKDMVLAVRVAGGYACYTLYPDAPHAIWNTVYGLAGNLNNPLYPWLFAQDRSARLTRRHNC